MQEARAGILDVNNAPVAGVRGCGGGVQEQRVHEQDVSGAGFANVLGGCLSKAGDVLGLQFAVKVGCRKHAQRSIFCGRVIKVKS